MKKKLLTFGVFIGLLVFPLTFPSPALAADPYKDCSGSAICDASNQKGEGQVKKLVQNVINLLLTISSVIAVIMIIVGGIRYSTSNGDSNTASSAKNTILYSVIGLVIAIFSYAIVDFVIKNI